MRNRFRALMLVGFLTAVVIPVAFALSYDADQPATVDTSPAVMAATVVAAPSVVPSASGLARPFPEVAVLFVVGAALIGVAAAVRRTSKHGLGVRN
jgi:hypothetical protein